MKFNLLILSLLICSYPVHSQVYKWVDENGKTHYSQTKPNHTQAPEVKKVDPRELGDFSANQTISSKYKRSKEKDSLYTKCVYSKYNVIHAANRLIRSPKPHRSGPIDVSHEAVSASIEREKKLKVDLENKIKKECNKYKDHWNN